MSLSSAFPAWPPHEQARLLTLQRSQILQSLRETVFTKIVQVTAQLFETPISLLGVVEATQVTYKAGIGWPFSQQPRAETLCTQVVEHGTIAVLLDIMQPPVPFYAPPTHPPGVRFYAGVPLRMPNEYVIGTLCIMDRCPREFGLCEQQVLSQLARVAERIVVARQGCLASPWLGLAHWQPAQAYIATALERLRQLANSQESPGGMLATLELAIPQLNELARVLAEPLPGFD